MADEAEIQNVTDQAVDLLGGQAALGRSLGVKQQVVQYWVKKAGRFPAEYILHIESLLAALGSEIGRYELRPDVYGARPDIQSDNNAA